MKRKRLSETEDILMNIFWKEGRPLTSSQLCGLAAGRQWSGSYVQKMLAGLQKHGYIEVCGVEREKTIICGNSVRA